MNNLNPKTPQFTIQLPLWPEAVRGGPNALLRSALFAGIQSKKRQVLGIGKATPDMEPDGVTIAAQDGIKIKFAGTQLNQYDADVFFEAIHRARRHPLETECLFAGSDFLKAIGRSNGKPEYIDLDNSFRRLRRGTVDIEWNVGGHRLIFTGSLISHYIRDTTTKLYKLTFAKEISTLFSDASWTALEWNERRALNGQPLAQWLHSYFSTHAAPFPVSAAFLHEKSGSPTKLVKHFKTELKRAFAVLHETLGWQFTWDGDLASLSRPVTDSQGRHLKRRAIEGPARRKKGSKMQLRLGRAPARSSSADELQSIGDVMRNLDFAGLKKDIASRKPVK